jgi:hypothetical protein
MKAAELHYLHISEQIDAMDMILDRSCAEILYHLCTTWGSTAPGQQRMSSGISLMLRTKAAKVNNLHILM